MSKQIQSKKEELLSLRQKISEYEQRITTPKKDIHAAKHTANNLEREMTAH